MPYRFRNIKIYVIITIIIIIYATYNRYRKTEQLLHIKDPNCHQVPFLQEWRLKIKLLNACNTINNLASFGAISKYTPVIVIAVRGDILKYQIQALSKLQDVSKTLIIFSHIILDEDSTNEIERIKFCRFTQIYFSNDPVNNPYNLLRQDTCRPDLNTFEKIMDKRRKFLLRAGLHWSLKSARYCQLRKYHWWNLNFVFTKLHILQEHRGLVLFLKHNDYMLKDCVRTLRKYETTYKNFCSSCNVIAVTRLTDETKHGDFKYKYENKFVKTFFADSSLAFNRTTFESIVTCNCYFCFFNEVFKKDADEACNFEKLMAFSSARPHIMEFGECDDGNCTSFYLEEVKSARAWENYYEMK